MKVTLVNTLSYAAAAADANNGAFLRDYYLPLGLLTIASVLQADGHSVSLVDPNLIARELASSDSRRLREAAAAKIASSAPDIVGFTTMCDSYHHTLAIAEIVKTSAQIPIILGGPHASVVARDTLANFPQVDFIVRGEAEKAIGPLLAAAGGKIPLALVPNLNYRGPSQLLETVAAPLLDDMDAVPAPAFHLYSDLAGKLACPPIEAGRGCPFQCDFCSTAVFFQRSYRLKSGARILYEMELLEHIFGSGVSFRLVHDMLTVNRRQVERLCEALLYGTRQRSWSCSARIDCVSAIC
jgi:radical SAM superfamily enzyme YgiQ (UPF0313 family)